ncbi:hypothetical protein JCM3775_000654 [Rhodotorula graminis]|uniref:Uncharacterized protein n=1 Tax=Rhodotorula graminis (strain WP1) TaxID=578459 RepID=A0A194S7M2_RHOGW|nr:uncharacterized protein RHOBADRAFT_52490 [Rhodotorula graminis WP1]KPV76490.1 hypothetical protein RHOBADRAFT_52490 [Rhodotorula graminis WP1]
MATVASSSTAASMAHPPSTSRDASPSPPRNHVRRNDSLRAIEQHAASVRRVQEAAAAAAAAQQDPAAQPARPKPVRLATPSSGYPFPVMVTTPRDEVVEPTLEPYRSAPRQKPPSRKGTPEGDGWDTPASSLSRASSMASKRSSAAPSRLAPLPGLTSTFSDSSLSSSSSSACSTPSDTNLESSASSPFAVPHSPPPPQQAPPTPAEVTRSRLKHAGSTPGAPPPAPLMQATQPVGQQLFDLQDVRLNAVPSPRNSPRHSPDPSAASGSRLKKDLNPLSSGVAGLSMSSQTKKEQPLGVGSKVEVD